MGDGAFAVPCYGPEIVENRYSAVSVKHIVARVYDVNCNRDNINSLIADQDMWKPPLTGDTRALYEEQWVLIKA